MKIIGALVLLAIGGGTIYFFGVGNMLADFVSIPCILTGLFMGASAEPSTAGMRAEAQRVHREACEAAERLNRKVFDYAHEAVGWYKAGEISAEELAEYLRQLRSRLVEPCTS